MIDTVRLRHSRPMPSPDELHAHGFISSCEHSNSRKYISNPPKGSNLPRLTWTRREDTGWLSAEVSLPKFYFGNNVRSLSDSEIESVLSDFGSYVEAKAGVNFEVESSLVSRADFANNFELENETQVKSYLRAFGQISHSRYSRRNENNSTVTFFNKSRQTCIYSKFDECLAKEEGSDLIKQSNGLLRFENRFINSQSCRRLAEKLGVERFAGNLLSNGVAKETLRAEMTRLGVDKTVVTSEARSEKLIKHFGTKASNYLGFLTMYEHSGKDFYQTGGISRATYFRMLSELRKAGLLIISESELPALKIE
jgi:hypothetical protein